MFLENLISKKNNPEYFANYTILKLGANGVDHAKNIHIYTL